MDNLRSIQRTDGQHEYQHAFSVALQTSFRYFCGLHRQLYSWKLEFKKSRVGVEDDVLAELKKEIEERQLRKIGAKQFENIKHGKSGLA